MIQRACHLIITSTTLTTSGKVGCVTARRESEPVVTAELVADAGEARGRRLAKFAANRRTLHLVEEVVGGEATPREGVDAASCGRQKVEKGKITKIQCDQL